MHNIFQYKLIILPLQSDKAPGSVVHQLALRTFNYQEDIGFSVKDEPIPPVLLRHMNNNAVCDTEEAVWHLFLWACLSNHRDIADILLSKSNCKIGSYRLSKQCGL